MHQEWMMKINRLPAPTWNWLKMNESIPDTEGIKKAEGALLLRWSQAEHKRKGSCFENGAANLKTEKSAEGIRIEEAGEWSEKTVQTATGMGKDMSRLLEKAGNAIVRITPEEGHTQRKIFLDFLYGKEDYRVNGVELYAPENTNLTVFMNYSSEQNGRGLAAVQTRFHAEKNAKIRIVQLQMLGSDYLHLNDIGGSCEEGASVEVLQIELGGEQVYAGCQTALLRNAGMNVELGYFGKESQLFDFNFVAEHIGENSVSQIRADGILEDAARKLFRGTIDFKTGAKGARGDETENVLLLGDDVINQTIPLILCGEEDVQGNHGATIGQLEEELLFYMASRGFSEEEAKNAVARGKIEALCRKIGDEKAEEKVKNFLEDKLSMRKQS